MNDPTIFEDPQAMRAASQRALKLTMALNNQYHEPATVRKLFFELIDQPEDDTFCLFPPFYTCLLYTSSSPAGSYHPTVQTDTGFRFPALSHSGPARGGTCPAVCAALCTAAARPASEDRGSLHPAAPD